MIDQISTLPFHEEGCRRALNVAVQGDIVQDQLQVLTFARHSATQLSALGAAASFKSPKAVEFILSFSDNLSEIELKELLYQPSGHDLRSPLYFACAAGSIECAKIILEKGAKINYAEQTDRYRPLHADASQGHTDVVLFLTHAGANAMIRGCDQRQAQDVAALAAANANKDAELAATVLECSGALRKAAAEQNPRQTFLFAAKDICSLARQGLKVLHRSHWQTKFDMAQELILLVQQAELTRLKALMAAFSARELEKLRAKHSRDVENFDPDLGQSALLSLQRRQAQEDKDMVDAHATKLSRLSRWALKFRTRIGARCRTLLEEMQVQILREDIAVDAFVDHSGRFFRMRERPRLSCRPVVPTARKHMTLSFIRLASLVAWIA